ncbi:FtsQ-type POTRA domain-containing protein [Leifsonia sp. fls2-241-R2A-40a]|uniref:FtsQ-type POTRA domain-containing protein n=1 Tax=Leifsonia sp. fls2-241-R2A-40a TaxID=3040290 RepID=UPI00254D2CED|nr:FtsQ-type POTRA domain-containing protein [Leifsonia sp. fls2-241-R2A-40a]
MKRPQGHDRQEVPASAPASRPSDPAGRDVRTSSGPSRSVGTVTEPIPVVRPERATTQASPLSAPAPSRETDSSPYSRLPSNREIDKALRAARRERKRLERGEVRRFTKRSRRRRLAWLAVAGVVVLLVVAVGLVAYSPLLALKHIQVTGTSRLDASAVEKKLTDQLGTPLPLLDQASISSDLAAFPLIRSYAVESHPPDSIVVRVVERQPVGVIQQGTAYTLVDAAKIPISSSEKRPDGYPMIAASGGAADVDADSGFAAAASVLSALPADVLAQVDTIAAKTKDDVSFTLRGRHATVVWGSAEDSSLKAADLAALLKSAGDASRYDVSSPHSVTTG